MKKSPSILCTTVLFLICLVIFSTSAYAASALKWTDVSVGFWHTAGLTSDGTLWCWGANTLGELGNGKYIHQNKPIRVMSDVQHFCAAPGSELTLAIKKDRSLWAWGNNNQYQVGNGGKGIGVSKPYKVLKDVIAVAPSGAELVYAVTKDGSLWAWGYSDAGLLQALPEGSISKRPMKIGKIANVKQIYANYSVLFVLKTDNSLWVLGTGSYNAKLTLDKLSMLLSNVQKVSIAPTGPVAVLGTDGSVWTWDYSKTSIAPVKVASDAQDATIFEYRKKEGYSTRTKWTVAVLKKDGMVTFLDSILSDVNVGRAVRIMSNDRTTFVIRDDGSLWGWGYNEYGQIGNGTTTDVEANAMAQVGAPVATKPKSVSISPKSATIYIGESATFSAYVKPAGAEQGLTWKTSKGSIATVQNGVVIGVSAGKVTITAESTTNRKIKATRNVTVKANALYRKKPLYSKSKRVYTSARNLVYSGDNVACQMFVYNRSGVNVASLRNLKVYFYNKVTKTKILVQTIDVVPFALLNGKYSVMTFEVPKAQVGAAYLDLCEVFAVGEYVSTKGKTGLVTGVGVV